MRDEITNFADAGEAMGALAEGEEYAIEVIHPRVASEKALDAALEIQVKHRHST